MKYVEIEIMVRLKKDIHFLESNEMLAININTALCKNNSELHFKKGFKGYVFNNLFPLEKNKIYKNGNNYFFKLRVIDNLYQNFNNFMKNYSSNDFEVVLYRESIKNIRRINKLYSLTPVLIRLDKKKNWTKEEGIGLLKQRLISNMSKKFEQFYNKKIDVDFIESIQLTNNKPIKIKYKNFHYLTNKVQITVNMDKQSQELAFLALSTGLGEGNSYLGLGYCVDTFSKPKAKGIAK